MLVTTPSGETTSGSGATNVEDLHFLTGDSLRLSLQIRSFDAFVGFGFLVTNASGLCYGEN